VLWHGETTPRLLVYEPHASAANPNNWLSDVGDLPIPFIGILSIKIKLYFNKNIIF